MESERAAVPNPAADLAAADAARQRLVESLHLPSGFHTSIGAAIAAQIAGMAYGIVSDDRVGLLVLVAGCIAFLTVAAVQLLRFRRLNQVRIDGLSSRGVLGTSVSSSLAYVGGLAAALWAAVEGQWWIVVLASLAGGTAYALAGRAWWDRYRREPEAHARAETRTTLLVAAGAALAGALALMALTR